MSVFLFKRLLTFLATLAVASVLVFWVLERLPGNVAQVMLGETATPEAILSLERKNWAWTGRRRCAMAAGWLAWSAARRRAVFRTTPPPPS